MNDGRTVFTQLMEFVPFYEFRKCVDRYHGNYRSRTFSCLDQFLCMAFAQLTYRESLRDIETCLRTFQSRLYHAGFRGKVSRSTLADANETRPWRIYADFAQILIRIARPLYLKEDFGVTLDQTAYAFDATTIDLSLSVFPWAPSRQRKAGVKLHTLLDLRGSIPCFIHITRANINEVRILDQLLLEPGAFYIMDRGFLDYARLYVFTKNAAFFITRAKKHTVVSWRASRPVDKSTGLRSDQTIHLAGLKADEHYPDNLRRIHYLHPETQKNLVFLTNNFTLPALTIAQLYKARWRVELFFKWIKQYLRIKAFYGTSENAVKTQIWIAVSTYVLIAIIKKKLNLVRSPGEILQILSLTLFEKIVLYQLLANFDLEYLPIDSEKQLELFSS